jgi:phosphoribosylformylglycinamidine synthase PurS subunit
MARVVVDVMPKPEILDPQGKAVTGALARLGFTGMSVRQGKRFELELDGEVTEERLAEVRRAAETLLANTVIETFDVRVEEAPEPAADDGADRAEETETTDEARPVGEAEAERAEETETTDEARPVDEVEAIDKVKPVDTAEPSAKAGDSDEVVITDGSKQSEAKSTGAGPAGEAEAADGEQPAGDEAKSADKAERDGHAQPADEAKATGDAERDGHAQPADEAKAADDAELARQAG